MLRFCHRAMATEFALLIANPDLKYAANASRAAFEELDRLETLLSRFCPNSDIARMNSSKKAQSIIVSPETMECLQIAQRLSHQTEGLFDITVGRLVEMWKSSRPSEALLQKTLQTVGMDLLEICSKTMSVRIKVEGLRIDLGGIGKGYALGKMAELLKEWRIQRALLHGGTSSVFALAPPEGQSGWTIQLTNPITQTQIRKINLCNQSLSCSGLRRGTDMIRPDCGLAIQDKSAVWVKGDDPAVCDAFSTAVMVMMPDELEQFSRQNPQIGILILTKDKPNDNPLQLGPW